MTSSWIKAELGQHPASRSRFKKEEPILVLPGKRSMLKQTGAGTIAVSSEKVVGVHRVAMVWLTVI